MKRRCLGLSVVVILVLGCASAVQAVAALSPNTVISPHGIGRFKFWRATLAAVNRAIGKPADAVVGGGNCYGGGEGFAAVTKYTWSRIGSAEFAFVTPTIPGPLPNACAYTQKYLPSSKLFAVGVYGAGFTSGVYPAQQRASDGQRFRTDRGTRLGMTFAEARDLERGRLVMCTLPYHGGVEWNIVRQTATWRIQVQGFVVHGSYGPVLGITATLRHVPMPAGAFTRSIC